MIIAKRYEKNPILEPDIKSGWESEATFNGCPVKHGNHYHMLYRALSAPVNFSDVNIKISSIGCAKSQNGFSFSERKQLIKPEEPWEKFGCEDPRVTYFEGKYYIFYTALSTYPFTANGIKVGLVVTNDCANFEKKSLVTSFNSKAMALFPQRINKKIAAILTANTDQPPAKIAIAFFDDENQITSESFWKEWYKNIDGYTIPLQRSTHDHIEVGAPPVLTDEGWLLIYSYIRNYTSNAKVFGIEAVLLDRDNPQRILGYTEEPLLVPEKHYELYGQVPHVIFPSGAILEDHKLNIYYGAADTSCAVATVKLQDLLDELNIKNHLSFVSKRSRQIKLIRAKNNPIITPDPNNSWETWCTFNPAAIYFENKVHIFYRAMGKDETSVLGYANSKDAVHLDEKLNYPVYTPREKFEMKIHSGFSGCEDPRLTLIDDRIYMTYTAYDGVNPTRVAITSIKPSDITNKLWGWSTPTLISPPGIDDKNTCLLSEKINGKYCFLHRIAPCIWIDYTDDLSFKEKRWLGGDILMSPRTSSWDSEKIGIAAPPIKTDDGWLLIYHGLSNKDNQYRLGAALLDLNDHHHIISRLDYPILEPQTPYEFQGVRPACVFANGAIVIDDHIYIYYGGADTVVGVASASYSELLEELKKYRL